MRAGSWLLVPASLLLAALFHALRAQPGADARREASPVPREQALQPGPRAAAPSTIKASGVIKPRVGAEVRVGSRLSGVVTRLHVQVGDTVAAGQPLARLDDRELIARRDEARASLQKAMAESRHAGSVLRRQQVLRAVQSIAPSDIEASECTFAVSRHQIAIARAALECATAQLDYTRIVAPIAGVVASVTTQEGETVSAGFSAPTFVTLIDLARLEVWAYVDETDIGWVRPGLEARFTVDTYGDRAFTGRVTAIYPKAEIRDNVVNYIAVVQFPLPQDCLLRPEMTATVRIARDSGEARAYENSGENNHD